MNKFCIGQIKSLITIFFTVLLSLTATARVHAQTGGVTIKLREVPMERVIDEIERTTSFLFLSNKDVNLKSLVSVDVESRPIAEALSQMVRGTDVSYKIEGNYIVLSKTEKTPLTIKGVVTDGSGSPVVGASVTIKGTTIGISTDGTGSFTLTVPPTALPATLVVNYLGYETVETAVGTRTDFRIVMKDAAIQVENVVVTALGIHRQERALSYNVQQIKAEEITRIKDANFMNSLVGKVAGVQINSGANGPGSGVRVVMRGEKSIEKSNNVLYVIDGIPMYNSTFSGGEGVYMSQAGSEGIADINPEDIESINMLTGPSAAALYGSDAANGVVVINTKRGEKGRTVVNVSSSTTFSKVKMLPEMQNTYGTSSGYMNWGDRYDSSFDAKKFFNTGTNIFNSVSVSTGTDRNQTYVSASSTNAAGTIVENTYDRYNFTVRNTTVFAKDKLTFDFGANYILQNDKGMVSQGKYNNPLPSLYLFPRSDDFDEIRLFERWDPVLGYMVQYWPYGEGAHSLQNPYWIQKRMKRESDKRRYMFNASLKWDVTDWLNVVGRLRVDNSEYRITEKIYASTLTTFADPDGGYSDRTQHDRSFYADVMVNFNKTFGTDFTLIANVGASINNQRFEEAGVTGNLKITNHFAMNNINYQERFKPIQSGWREQNQAVFASVEGGWRSMLYLTVTARSEWPSQLAFTENSSYIYPSVGISGIISNMVSMPEWISFLKVRGSYSQVASAFQRFMSNPSAVFNEQSQDWSNPTTHPAFKLKPEDTRSWELGIDARFLGKIKLDATLYRSNTYNQTIYAPLPASSGYQQIVVQTGNIQNQGIELGLGYGNSWGGFTWDTWYTYTLNQNKIRRLGNGAVNPYTGEVITDTEIQKSWLGSSNVAPIVILCEGGSMSDIYVNHEIKRDLNGHVEIDPTTGDITMEETEFRKVGQLSPRYSMGWSNTFGFKGVEVGILVTARVGGLAYSATQGILDYYGTSQATAAARDRGGIPVNFGTVDPQKYYTTISTPEGGHGLYYLYSATNIRLQELSVSYRLPSQWFRDKARLTVGLVASNLAMLYCKAPFDPELSPSTTSNYYQGVDYFMQPPTRNIGFNVKLQF